MPKKLPVSELLRLACLYAEQDRVGWLSAHGYDDGEELDPTVQEELAFLEQLREYRKKRWGRTRFENYLDQCESVPFEEFFKDGPEETKVV